MMDKKFILQFIEVYHGLFELWDVKAKIILIALEKVLIEKYSEKIRMPKSKMLSKKLILCRQTSGKSDNISLSTLYVYARDCIAFI